MTARRGFLPASAVDLRPDRWTRPFWDAGLEDRLVVCRCASCGTCRMPPTPFCPHCQSQEVEWPDQSPEAKVFTYTVVHRSSVPTLRDLVPFAIAVAELSTAPGCRIVANFTQAMPQQLFVGMPVNVCWDHISPEIALPVLTIADEQRQPPR
jgi:uncharacterized protein